MRHFIRWSLLVIPVLFLIICVTEPVLAQAPSFVYINENDNNPNHVSAFRVGANHGLTLVAGSPFSTGGTSTGAGLFAATELVTSPVGPWLFATNTASDDISVLTINAVSGALTPISGSPFTIPVATGDSISLAPTPDGRYLISGSGTGLVVFSIAPNGALTPVAGSATTLASVVGGLAISPDGRWLAVPTLGVSRVAVFRINADGSLSQAPGSPFANFGNASCATFTSASDRLYIGTASTNVIVNGFAVAPDGALTTLPGSPYVTNGAGNSNAVLLSRDNRTLYVSNQNSNTVTAFAVGANGSLTLVSGSPFATGEPSGVPCGMALDYTGQHLYVSNSGRNSVSVFAIGSGGVLQLIAGSPFGSGGISGQSVSLATVPQPPGFETIGLYLADSGAWFLRNSNTPGVADVVFTFGPGGTDYVALSGDWDGDGDETPGIYNTSTGVFFLRNSNSPGVADTFFGFGPGGPGIRPIVGDWDGNGSDTIGLYAEISGTFFLRNSNTSGNANVTVSFGPGGSGVVPVRGDFDGDGDDTLGIYVESTGIFFLKNVLAGGGADLTFGFGSGGSGQVPLFGDYDGDGDDTVGLAVVSTGTFFLKNTNASGTADAVLNFGGGQAQPLIGDWNGN